MRLTLYRKKMESLLEALDELGYRETSNGWRREDFHFIIMKTMKDRVIINIHKDARGLRSLHRRSEEGAEEEAKNILCKYYEIRKREEGGLKWKIRNTNQ